MKTISTCFLFFFSFTNAAHAQEEFEIYDEVYGHVLFQQQLKL